MPELNLEVYELPKEFKDVYWNIFKKHHYMSGKLNKAADCYVGYLWGNPVVFNSVLRMPCGTIKNAYRGHRLVVLCDYQGMGLGTIMSELAGELVLRNGGRYFCKTANIKLGIYRNKSEKWRPTSKNMIKRKDLFHVEKDIYNKIHDKALALRVCYSHEYIGGLMS